MQLYKVKDYILPDEVETVEDTDGVLVDLSYVDPDSESFYSSGEVVDQFHDNNNNSKDKVIIKETTVRYRIIERCEESNLEKDLESIGFTPNEIVSSLDSDYGITFFGNGWIPDTEECSENLYNLKKELSKLGYRNFHKFGITKFTDAQYLVGTRLEFDAP